MLSTLYAGLVSVLVYRDLSWKRLNDAVVHSGLATGVVLLVIMASAAIGWLLTFDRMPDGVTPEPATTIPGLATGTPVTLRVRAVNAVGNSAWSEWPSALPWSAAPSPSRASLAAAPRSF